jgi:hypothetical protein
MSARLAFLCSFLAIAQTAALGQNGSHVPDAAMAEKIRESARTYLEDLSRLTCIENTRQTISVAGVTLSENREDSCDTRQYKLWGAQAITLAAASNALGRSRRRGGATSSSAANLSEQLTDASLEANSQFLEAVIHPATRADFRWVRSVTLNGQTVSVFSFAVPASEGYVLVGRKRTVRAPYKGLLYADPLTGAVIRAALKCFDIPRGFDYTGADLTLDFKPFDVGGSTMGLPSHSLVHLWMVSGEAANEANYRSYRVADFSTDSVIKFDAEPAPPAPKGAP